MRRVACASTINHRRAGREHDGWIAITAAIGWLQTTICDPNGTTYSNKLASVSHSRKSQGTKQTNAAIPGGSP